MRPLPRSSGRSRPEELKDLFVPRHSRWGFFVEGNRKWKSPLLCGTGFALEKSRRSLGAVLTHCERFALEGKLVCH